MIENIGKNIIGVMDSGLGGLTVLQELVKILPNESFIYFGDNARAPYGSCSREQLDGFVDDIFCFFKKKQVKAIVLACNTTTSLGIEKLQKKIDVPVIGMNNGVKMAFQESINKKIGVLATKATIQSNFHKSSLLKYGSRLKFWLQACPQFVPLIEQGIVCGQEIENAVLEYCENFSKNKVDTIILGCTHYKLIADEIKKFFLDSIKLIDPAQDTAKDALNLLREKQLLNAEKQIVQEKIRLNFSKKIEEKSNVLIKKIFKNESFKIKILEAEK